MRKAGGRVTSASAPEAKAAATAEDILSTGCISPRRLLARLDEEEEPNSEAEEGDDCYEDLYQSEGDEDGGIDPIDTHTTKRRRISSDGRYTKVWTAKPGFIQSAVNGSLVDVETEHCECDMRTHKCLGSIYRVSTAVVLSRGERWLVMVRAKSLHALPRP